MRAKTWAAWKDHGVVDDLVERARADVQERLPAGTRYEIRQAVQMLDWETGKIRVAVGWFEVPWTEPVELGVWSPKTGVYVMEQGVVL